MTRKPPPTPPSDLSSEAKRWWAGVIADYELEPHHVNLLVLAARAWDRAEQARLELERVGPYYEDRFGAPHAHPGVRVEIENRRQFQSLLRELCLDDVAAPPAPRLPSHWRP